MGISGRKSKKLLRNQENLKERGASFGRLKSEFVEPLVAAVVDILVKRGILTKMRIDGKQVTIQHESPLAKAEDMEDFQNSQVWMSSIAQLASISPIAGNMIPATIKIEELPRYWQQKLGIPAELIRTEQERQQVAEAAQQAAQASLAAQGGGEGGGEQQI